MKTNRQTKRLFSMLLALIMVIGLMPQNMLTVHANAEATGSSDPVIVLAASDFQHSGGHSTTAAIVSGILETIYPDYTNVDGFLFAGDYDYNYSDSANGKAKLQETVLATYPDLDTDSMIWVQGNHDPDSLVGSTLSSSGAHDADAYGVYVINEKDYMWYNDDEATIRNTAASLDAYLDAKVAAEYTSPIFVVSHLPLHYSMRTLKGGNDGMHANYIFDVLNEAGEAGLNIIFMFGHNHSHGWDDYLGGAAIFLQKGDKINIAQNSTTVYQEETLNFTYMNAGYIGYYGETGSGVDSTLTMTVFEIWDDRVNVKRYDEDGVHNLKASGAYGGEYPDNRYANPVYDADDSVVSGSAEIMLDKSLAVPDVVIEDEATGVTVSAPGITDLAVSVTNTTPPAGYRAYITYDIAPAGFTEGKTAAVTAPVGGDFDEARPVIVIDHALDQISSANIVDGTVTFTTTHFGAFSLAQVDPDAGVSSEGELIAASVTQITSFSELKEDVGYLIVADEGSDITLTNQTSNNGLLLSGSVSADNTNLWYLDLENEYIRYGSPTGSDNYLKVASNSASVGNSTNRVTEISENSDGTFYLYRSRYYLNRYGGSTSTRAAGYTSQTAGNKWKFYEVVAGTGGTVTLTVTPSTVELMPGAKITLYSAVQVNGEDAQNPTVTWTSSDETKATVSAGGTVTAVAEGTVEITATLTHANGQSLQNAISVTVSVTITEHDYETVTVEATCTENGSVTTTCTICGESTVEVIEALGHDYRSAVTGATCGKDGSAVYTCAACGDSYTEILPATGEHSYETVTVSASCTEGGYTTYTCTVCGDSHVADNTDALGHSYETAAVDATCTEDGSVTYYCSACGDIYTEIIPASGHSYQTTVTEATCTEGGFTTHTCTACGDSYITDTTDALGHSYVTATVEPTCTTGGYTSCTCSNCGDGYTYDETEALGHDYVSVTVEATETEDGYTTHTCNTCGHSYTDNYVDALGHSIVSVVTEATCETDGYTTHTCASCGESYVDSYVPAFGHDYETITVDATCTEDGSSSSTCTVCGETVSEVIAALGHDYAAVVTAPTCTEGGHTVYTCGRCGDSHVADYTEALGHSYQTITVEATCTEEGSVTQICTNCGDSYVSDSIPALGHSYQTVTVDPTCTEDGSVTQVCSNCGDSSAEVIAASGHDYQSAVTAPSCTEDGYTTHTCAACGDSYVDSYTDLTGHSYTCVESDGYLVYTCDYCGDSYSEALETEHIYSRVTSISSGSNYVITLYSGRKYYALSHADNEVSVVQVTVSDGEITSEITEDLIWTYSNRKLSYEDDGTTYYLYAGSSGSGGWWGSWWGSSYTLSLSSSNSSSVSFSNSKLKVGSYYLRYSSGNATLNRSATTTYLFIEE